MSIHPQYTELILAGKKTVELRKRRPQVPAGTLVVMYASLPTCAIVGAFILSGVVGLEPEQLWAKHGPQTGVSKDLFERYYANRDQAFGLLVGEVLPLERRVSLAALRARWSGFHPPQSYRYLHWARNKSSLQLQFAAETASFTLS